VVATQIFFGIFTPNFGEDELILTSIFFKWVMFFDFLPGKPIVLHSLKLTAKSTLKIMGFDLKTESPKTSREAPIFRCNPAVSFREGSGQVTWHSSIMEALPPSRPSSNEVPQAGHPKSHLISDDHIIGIKTCAFLTADPTFREMFAQLLIYIRGQVQK